MPCFVKTTQFRDQYFVNQILMSIFFFPNCDQLNVIFHLTDLLTFCALIVKAGSLERVQFNVKIKYLQSGH